MLLILANMLYRNVPLLLVGIGLLSLSMCLKESTWQQACKDTLKGLNDFL